jgi:hypothetical protein
MSKSYKKQVQRLKRLQAILMIVCLLVFISYAYFITRPKISSYDVKDECGPIGGTISHPIDDEDACDNICGATCLSKDKLFHKSKFVLKDPECNICTCYCKE